MKPSDREDFAAVLGGVYEFYQRELSAFALGVWWEAMQAFEPQIVYGALARHAMNPDTGQFLPKPADVVKMLGGTTKDAAIIAWAKVDKAVRHIGSWTTVVFDDPLVHRCIEELGGWMWLGAQTTAEWPFIEKRFIDHYRAYKARGETPAYLPKLFGHTDTENLSRGFPAMLPALIGDPWVCAQVMEGGALKRQITMGEAAARALPERLGS